MRRFANGTLVGLTAIVMLMVASNAQAGLLVEFGNTGQAAASGWQQFSVADGTVTSASQTFGAITVGVATAGSENLQFKNRDAVTYSNLPGAVLSDCVVSSDSDLTLSFSGLAAGRYNLTTYLHDSRWGADGRNSETVTLHDANGAAVVGTNVYYTQGTTSPFNYKLSPTGGMLTQAEPSMLSMTVVANGTDPVSVVYMGGMYQGKTTSPALSGFSLDAVPEPGSFVLIGAGLVGLLAYAWKKRR
jgi:hypothetical protein